MNSSRFLQDASPQRLRDAIAQNHAQFLLRSAKTNDGDASSSENYDWSPRMTRDNEAKIAYPNFNPSTLSEDLDRFLDQCPERGIHVVSANVLGGNDFAFFAPALLARGFGSGGRYDLMALDLTRMKDDAAPEGLRIGVVENAADWNQAVPDDLRFRATQEASGTNGDDRKVWRFGAWLDGRPAGHLLLATTHGPLGIAGLHSLRVTTEGKDRGVDEALLLTVGRFAKDLGCRYAAFIAEGEKDYQNLGLEAVGWGQSFWIQDDEFDAGLPTAEVVAFLEAVGRGETENLERLRQAASVDLDQLTLCGRTPLEIAAFMERSDSAEWLLQHGATPDLVSLWRLGWIDRILDTLSRQPDLINRRFSNEKKTPLHEAVWRNDAEFAKFLLGHGADPTLEDGAFESTPLGWAEHLHRPNLIPILEHAVAS
jgi:hypothetical protein